MPSESRRRFIRRAAAVSAATFIDSSVTRVLAQEPGEQLGWVLCGLGGMSTAVAHSLQKTQHCKLVGVITDAPEKARSWQAQYGIPAKNVYSYDIMERMAGNHDIDVVYVMTPNALHLENALRAVGAGKHVYVEKPMEISVERCQQMIGACKAANRKLGVAYRVRFEPNNLECVRIARQKEFGPTRFVEASFCLRIGDPNQWRLKRDLSGGGALMDLGVYAIQATRYITGEEPVVVSAMEAKTDAQKYREVDEHISWQMRFPSGVLATCNASYEAAGISRLFVQAERGWFELDNAFWVNGIQGRRSDGKSISLPNIDQLAAQMDDFSRCIIDNKDSRVAGEEGLRDVRIMKSIYESIASGRPIAIT